MPNTNRVDATLIIRNGIASNWTTRNPILAQGEFGLEDDTYLIKVGDGVTDWIHLPYLNKLNEAYFKRLADGSLTFSDAVANIIAGAGGGGSFVITDDPTEPTDPVNLRYLEWAIAHAGHLKREIVLALPDAASADENTLYMVPSSNGEYYEEYMVINGAWDMVGETGDGGGSGGFQLEIATTSRLGGVKASNNPNEIAVDPNTGVMSLNQVSTSLLYVPTGDTLVLYGGTA